MCMHILCRYHEFVSVSVCKGGTYVRGGGGMCRTVGVCVHVEVVIYVCVYFST